MNASNYFKAASYVKRTYGTEMQVWESSSRVSIGALSVVGNFLEITFFCTRRKSKRNGKIEVQLSLAFVDLIAGVLMIVSQVGKALVKDDLARGLYFLLESVMFSLITVSLYHLSIMSIMGYFAIRVPIRYMLFMKSSKVKMTVLCILVWLAGIPTAILNSLEMYYSMMFYHYSKELYHRTVLKIRTVDTLHSFLLPCLTALLSTLLMCKAYFEDSYENRNGQHNELFINKRWEFSTIGIKSQHRRSQTLKQRHLWLKHHSTTTSMVFGYFITCLPFFLGALVTIYLPLGRCGYIVSELMFCFVLTPLLLSNGLVTVLACMKMDIEFRAFVKRSILSCITRRTGKIKIL